MDHKFYSGSLGKGKGGSVLSHFLDDLKVSEGIKVIRLLNEIENQRKVICVTGGIGKGKTISTSTIANELKENLNADLFSNYKLANSVDISEFSLSKIKESDRYTIVCIDEFGSVLRHSLNNFECILEYSLDEKVIIIIDSFDITRLPETIRKNIDIHLSVDKKDTDTVELKGVNVDFNKIIKIHESKVFYDSFAPAKLNF